MLVSLLSGRVEAREQASPQKRLPEPRRHQGHYSLHLWSAIAACRRHPGWSARDSCDHPSTFVLNGLRLVVVATPGWRNGPLLSTRSDNDDDDDCLINISFQQSLSKLRMFLRIHIGTSRRPSNYASYEISCWKHTLKKAIQISLILSTSSFSLNHHLYADDTQQFVKPPHMFSENISLLQTAIDVIAGRMTSNLLCLNSSETGFLLLCPQPQLSKVHHRVLAFSNGVSASASARNLGFIFDSHPTFSNQIFAATRATWMLTISVIHRRAGIVFGCNTCGSVPPFLGPSPKMIWFTCKDQNVQIPGQVYLLCLALHTFLFLSFSGR